jgi:hypothetical protein
MILSIISSCKYYFILTNLFGNYRKIVQSVICTLAIHLTLRLQSTLWIEWGVSVDLDCPVRQIKMIIFNNDSPEIACLVDQGDSAKHWLPVAKLGL